MPHLYISDAESAVKGVSEPSACASAMARAVLPVPGCPAISTACPANLPSRIIFCTTPAARRACNEQDTKCQQQPSICPTHHGLPILPHPQGLPTLPTRPAYPTHHGFPTQPHPPWPASPTLACFSIPHPPWPAYLSLPTMTCLLSPHTLACFTMPHPSKPTHHGLPHPPWPAPPCPGMSV